MSLALDRINRAGAAEAESIFRDCCGSPEWSKRMAASRPFDSEDALMQTAAGVWNDLQAFDWLEAFAAHPKIGETKPVSTRQKQSEEWSAREQAGMGMATERLQNDLAAANRDYYAKFGFIFIVCATGKTADEMLELCRSRMSNDLEMEIGVAAAEQQKITELRLRKLLSQ